MVVTDSEAPAAAPVALPIVPTRRGLDLFDPVLQLLADALTDLEAVRIAQENRYRQLTRTEADSDGVNRGFGLTEEHPQVAVISGMVDALQGLEHSTALSLKRQLRTHPLGPWVKEAGGVGERQAARLLASIGDPYWNTLHDRPRTVSELWAYCGLHVLPASQSLNATHTTLAGGDQTGSDPGLATAETHTTVAGVAPRRRRGQQNNWSEEARKRIWLVAKSCMKMGDRAPYGIVYKEGRVKYENAVHAVECTRCGPSGNPAKVGSPLSPGHQDARATRLVMKAVLKDLWIESQRLHQQAE